MRCITIIFACLLAPALHAQPPLRFQWKAGDVHAFAVEQDITITETAPATSGGPLQTTTIVTKMKLNRTWTVQSVDADGSASLALTITAFRNETTRPVPGADGKIVTETEVIDSTTPEGAKDVAEYVGKPIATAKVDVRGRVSDVVSKVPDSRLPVELPFRFECPETAVAKWERSLVIKLDPPVGTGEKYDAVQTMAVGEPPETITVATSLTKPPTDPAELQPLLPFLWEGTVTFDAKAGQYRGSKLSIKKEIAEHQGKGTKFVFESRFEEKRIEK